VTSTRRSSIIKQINLIEGERAYLATDESFPLYTTLITPQGTYSGISYLPLSNGIHVLARTTPAGILVELSQQQTEIKPDLGRPINTYQTLTSLLVSPSVWIPVSAAGTLSGVQGRDIHYGTPERQAESKVLEIRVDLLN
jgi:hypothetical protein